MTIPSGIQNWLSQRIRIYIADTAEPEYLRALAERYDVLPVLIDWTAFWGLRADGDILVIDTETGAPPTVEHDARLRRTALFQGARKYPELKALVPQRPASARDCSDCKGIGRIDVPGVAPGTIICYCGGLGWLD